MVAPIGLARSGAHQWHADRLAPASQNGLKTKSGSSLALPYPIFVMVIVWLALGVSLAVAKCRKKQINRYLLPRVFVMCSPKTVQFHYELVLRVGLPSSNFNPDKHDIDLTIMGPNKNEIVPVTRLPTKILLDSPLRAGLTMIVYRLVEMPSVSALIARHCGPLKSWLYAYDFSVKDLATGKEQYYPLHQYIGSLQKVYVLGPDKLANAKQRLATVKFPIDDVPMPAATTDELHMIIIPVLTYAMFSVSVMPVACGLRHDILVVLLSAAGSGSLFLFLVWLADYKIKWSRARAEYFNEPQLEQCQLLTRVHYNYTVALFTVVVGLASLYASIRITDLKESLVWLVTLIDAAVLVVGGWQVLCLFRMGEALVDLGLRLKKTEVVRVGMSYSELVMPARIASKSGSQSNDGLWAMSQTAGSKLQAGKSFGPRSSVKSFGFDMQANLAKFSQDTGAAGLSSISAMSSTGVAQGKLARLRNKTDNYQTGPQSPTLSALNSLSSAAAVAERKSGGAAFTDAPQQSTAPEASEEPQSSSPKKQTDS